MSAKDPETRALLGIVYCPTCQQDTMPRDYDGICFFCDTVLKEGNNRNGGRKKCA